MIFFYLGVSILLVLGFLFVLWPWISNSRRFREDTEATVRQSVNIELYYDHLRDLESSKALGHLDAQQFEQLKQELEHNLLADIPSSCIKSGSAEPDTDNSDLGQDQNTTANQSDSYSYRPLLVVATLLSVVSIALYLWLGNFQGWQLRQQLDLQATLEQKIIQNGGSSEHEKQLDQLNRDLVEALGQYIAQQPNDLDARVLLARNAMSIGQHDKAIEVYQQILELQPQAAQIMAELAQAVFIKADNRAVPIVAMLSERALTINPKNITALSLMGIYNFQNQQYQQAISYWQRAIELYPKNSLNARALQNGLTQARNRLASDSDNGQIADENGSNSDQSAGINEDDQTTNPTTIKVSVSIASDMQVEPDHTVFVYARHWQGPKIPLAITKVKAGDLPLNIELDDSMSMMPGMNLGSAEQLELIARISKTGNASPQAEDRQASLGPIKLVESSDKIYSLVISEKSD